MQKICDFVTGLNRLLFAFAAMVIFAVVPILLYEVIARYAFDAPTVWAMEASTLIFGPHFMLAGPYLLHLRGHVAVDILSEKAHGPTKRGLEIFAYVVIAIFAGVFAKVSWPLAVNAWSLGETSFSAWNPPIWWMKFIAPFAFAMLLAQALVEAARALFVPAQESDALPNGAPANEEAR